MIATGSVLPPITPAAARTVVPAEIVQAYGTGVTAIASQVQSTLAPVPEPVATVTPAASVTVTVHGSSLERRARKRTRPPAVPSTFGS